ncbi:MAG: Ig-like domain-containing protein [Pyrinomonadaceae bacterium]
MRRINLRRATVLTSVTLTVGLAALYVGARVASCGQSDTQPVHALFDLTSQAGGPFPSDRFTVADPSQNTGLRVNLPRPDCAARPSDCEDVDVLNTLDGFNLQPRLSLPFDGPVDPATVNGDTVFLINLGDALDRGDRGGRRVGVNQVVWDGLTNTLHVQSDELLDQHTRYALFVTNGVRDAAGRPVAASESFRRLRHDLDFGQTHDPGLKSYRKALLDAMKAARAVGTQEENIVSASVFSTQSATALLEKIRDQIKAASPAPADFTLGPGGARTLFPLEQVTGMTWNQQRADNPPRLTAVALNPSLLRLIPGAVGRLAFGKYTSPDFTARPGEYIPPVGTRSGTPRVQGSNEVYFNLYLPSGPRPAAGWPVVIVGHGSGSNKNNVGANVAATFAAHGIATVAINQAGHGFGPLGTLTVTQTGGRSVTFAEGGRGFDQNRDGIIESREGDEAAAPRTIQLNRDGLIQTLADLMQLVRVIEVGVDVEGDGSRDLDPSRVYYFGASLGGIYATILAAVEPQVRATAANVAGGSLIENRRLFTGADSFRSRLAGLFAARRPSLVNSPGVNRIAGVAVSGPGFFNENMPLRDGLPVEVGLEGGASEVIQSPVVNTVAGAAALQEWFDRAAWAAQAANPVAYARHLRKSPLAGVPPRPVLFTFALGDQSMPNPSTTAILRAGELADRAVLYRHDLAYAEAPGLPKDPHMFTVGTGNPAFRSIALEAQRQVAIFLASDGALVIHPEPARFFEAPISSPLPEGLNYIP